MNDYYSATTVARLSLARSADRNTFSAAVEAAFDKLPSRTAIYQDKVNFYTDTGVANAYVVTMTPTLGSYTEGLKVAVKIATTNTGASTLNIDSLGARSIKRADGSAVEATDLSAGDIHEFRYDGTNFVMVTQSRVHLTQSAAAAGGPLTLQNQGKFTSEGSTSGYFEWYAALSTGGGRIDFSSGTDAATAFDLDADEVATTDADIRFFRNTNTSGNVEFTLYQGNGSSTKVHSFFAASAALCRTSGSLAIGLGSADRKVHIYDDATQVALIESSTAASRLSFQDSGSTGNDYVGIGSSGDDLVFRSNNADVVTLTGTSMSLAPAAADAMIEVDVAATYTAEIFLRAAVDEGGGFRYNDDTNNVALYRQNGGSKTNVIQWAKGSSLVQFNHDSIKLLDKKTPATASDTGETGQWCYDSNYFYACVSTNTWKRAALSTW